MLPHTIRPPRRMTIAAPLDVEKAQSVVAVSQRSLWPVVMVFAVLFLIATSIAGYFYYQYQHSLQAVETGEIEDLSEEIGKLMILPENETPTMATVTDREKLAEQPFFQKAENGDKVLIFTQSGRVILYRPSQKKIVDVTAVNVSQPLSETSAPIVSEPVSGADSTLNAPPVTRVALYNGSLTTEAMNRAESQLSQLSSALTVVAKENARKQDYRETLVIDVTGQNTVLVGQVASTLGGTVTTLPTGEISPPDVDILVIVGK